MASEIAECMQKYPGLDLALTSLERFLARGLQPSHWLNYSASGGEDDPSWRGVVATFQEPIAVESLSTGLLIQIGEYPGVGLDEDLLLSYGQVAKALAEVAIHDDLLGGRLFSVLDEVQQKSPELMATLFRFAENAQAMRAMLE